MRRFFAVLLLLPCCARAQEAEPQVPLDEPPAYKLTVGAYRYPEAGNALDLNLRNTSKLGNTWIGFFRFPAEDVRQWRTGWDKQFGERVQVKPSVQAASGGFLGGSIQAQVGAPWFAAVGIGRTNLRPYYNLNFDPNDAYTVQAGYQDEKAGRYASILLVHDNREHPDQRHLHFTWREGTPDRHRFSVDVLYKSGTVEEEQRRIHRWGASASYDWPRFFVVLAYDPKTNFTPLDLWRLSFGTRF